MSLDRRIQFHPGQRAAIAGKLLAGLVKVVVVQMQIAKGMNKSPGLKSQTCATIIVSSEYDAMLKGTPRN